MSGFDPKRTLSGSQSLAQAVWKMLTDIQSSTRVTVAAALLIGLPSRMSSRAIWETEPQDRFDLIERFRPLFPLEVHEMMPQWIVFTANSGGRAPREPGQQNP